MFDALLTLATSYPENHNFWRGGPTDWWLRGIAEAFELNAIPLAGGVLLFWISSRTMRWRNWFLGWTAVCFFWSVLLPSMAYRDSDTPTAIGWRWGDRCRPWVTLASIAISTVPLISKSRKRPAFEVLPVESKSQHPT